MYSELFDVPYPLFKRSGYADHFKVAMTNHMRKNFLVPFDRDSHFVGRDDVIEELENRIKTTPRVSLAGIGGVGSVF